MKRFIPLSLVAGAIAVCLSAGAGQAATLSGADGLRAASASAPTLVTKAHWRHWHHWHHRRCWWHHHHRHCRYWR